jgi:hypothetical protein
MHNQIIYYMAKQRAQDNNAFLTPSTLQSVLNASRMSCNNSTDPNNVVDSLAADEPLNVLTVTLPEATIMDFANRSMGATNCNNNHNSNSSSSSNTMMGATSFLSLSRDNALRTKEIERQNLEELYSLGFIIQEEYQARRSALESW